MHRNERNLHEVSSEISTGDLLLFRGRSVASWMIRRAGRSEYSHAAKADRWGSDLFCCETREWKGGRIVTLASQVRKYPGQIDVYRTNPEKLLAYSRLASAGVMRQYAGEEYGYRALWEVAKQYLVVLRLLAQPAWKAPPVEKHLPFCSSLCARADRMGGYDPVPNLADRFVTPGDLARSTFYRYMFTLMAV